MRGSSLIVAAASLLAACGTPEPADDGAGPAANQAAPAAAPVGAPPPERQAGTEIPPAFRGVYDSSLEACARPSENRLTISASELRFHESIGTVREVAVEGPEAVRLVADFQGEGESWRAPQRLRLADRGATLTIAGEGTGLTRTRCPPAEAAAAPAAAGWQGSASGEGAALYLPGPGRRRLTLFCPAGSGDLVVNVPAFRPVSSEERMSFGAGGIAITLVADARGDARRGGVTGRGPLPAELPAILAAAEGIAVNYGAQNGGPHAPPPPELARSFIAGCRG